MTLHPRCATPSQRQKRTPPPPFTPALLARPQLYFAKVPRTAQEEDVRALFAPYGPVTSVTLFRTFAGAVTSKVTGELVAAA